MTGDHSPNLVAEAKAAQARGGYRVDVWLAWDLKPMTKLWQGIGGMSPFFFSEEDVREARGAYEGAVAHRFAQTLWRLAQVSPSPALGYRLGIREFVVDIETPSAVGICDANPQLGTGSVLQYYVRDWQSRLGLTGRQHFFPQKGYP